MNKATLRSQIKEALQAFPMELRAAASVAIARGIHALPQFHLARCVALFAPLPSEPDLTALLSHSKTFCFPRMTAAGLEFHAANRLEEMMFNAVQVREPRPDLCPAVGLEEIDLALVPGLAFEPSSGLRLGRGGGYYDRLLADPKFRACTVGVCFAMQLTPDLPREPHDRAVHLVMTENGLAGA